MDKNKNDKWIAPGQQISTLSESCLKQAGKDASRYVNTGAETYRIVFTFNDGSTMSCHYYKYAGQKKVGYLYTVYTLGDYLWQLCVQDRGPERGQPHQPDCSRQDA